MRIIKIDITKERKVTCSNCAAVVGFFNSEIKDRIEEDYGGGRDTVYYIECPNCKKVINVNRY